MAVEMVFRLASIILAIIATNARVQSSPIFTSGGSLTLGKGDRYNARFVSEENPLYLSKPLLTNCASESQAYDIPREYQGKESFQKAPTFRLENNPRSFIEDRLFLALGGVRPKKAQKAILLDVGDYVMKNNGSPGEGGQPVRSNGGGAMGGILRSSG